MATGYAIGLDQAQKYLNDPFTDAQPIDETGLNSHFRSTFDPVQPGGPVQPAVGTASPRRPSSAHNSSAAHSRHASRELKTRSRGSSLSQRYPGDKSHQPLDMLKLDAKKANRSYHLRKSSIPAVDTIDALDDSVPGAKYHHEGPYDATLASRNRDSRHSPVAATFDTTVQALKATPPEKIRDSLDRHLPLDGIASVAPGYMDKNGRMYEYEDGQDVAKGQSLNDVDQEELDKKERGDQLVDAAAYDGDATGIELVEHEPKNAAPKKDIEVSEHEIHGDESPSGRHKHNALDGLKRRIGSLRKKHD